MYDSKRNAEFAARLKNTRIDSGYETASKFARSIGMNPATYGGYERGDKLPKEQPLKDICKNLKISPEWLMEGKTEREDTVSAPAGKHEACEGPKKKAADEEHKEDKELPEEEKLTGFRSLLELIDAIDDMDPDLPGYLVEGKALREALQGDPNGDKAPAYLAMLCSKPAVVNYYRDRTHMRELNSAGTISNVEYRDWFIGRRELLRMTPINPPEKCKATGMKCDPKPMLKCTSEGAKKE